MLTLGFFNYTADSAVSRRGQRKKKNDNGLAHCDEAVYDIAYASVPFLPQENDTDWHRTRIWCASITPEGVSNQLISVCYYGKHMYDDE